MASVCYCGRTSKRRNILPEHSHAYFSSRRASATVLIMDLKNTLRNIKQLITLVLMAGISSVGFLASFILEDMGYRVISNIFLYSSVAAFAIAVIIGFFLFREKNCNLY